MEEGTLVLSSNRGRYALGHSEYGPDLSSGHSIEVLLGGQWVPGRVWHDNDDLYATLGPQTLEEVAQMAARPRAIGGYYFVDGDGAICGLCVGMKVRL